MKASICIASYNRKPSILTQVMDSIFQQRVPFDFEVVLCDDGSEGTSTREVCNQYPVQYHRIDRKPGRRNPCTPRNVAYRAATGDIIIAQSDEVVHKSPKCVETLVSELEEHPTSFIIATVLGCSPKGKPWSTYTGTWVMPNSQEQTRHVPYFFLGALWRNDLYAIGGNDEAFSKGIACEDSWFAQCLMKGLGLVPTYTTQVIGYHLHHPPVIDKDGELVNRRVSFQRHKDCEQTGTWCAIGGPWLCGSYKPSSIERKFTKVYTENTWGAKESVGGPGSSMKATQSIREALPGILGAYNIKSVLDIPCGDFNWMQHVNLGTTTYIGADIVKPLIARNKQSYKQNGTSFQHLDLLSSELPRVDLIICRDCLGHLSLADATKALRNIRSSGSKYLLTTTFFQHRTNRDTETGKNWVPRQLTSAPFNLPAPRLVIDEMCREVFPKFQDKSLALWPIADLSQV